MATTELLPTLIRPLMMLSLPLALWLLPVKAPTRGLVALAFFIWFAGGIFLSLRGVDFLTASNLPQNELFTPLIIASLIGYLKGKFVLSKASSKNLARLYAFTQPQPLIAVYPMRSWILIGVMVALSMVITLAFSGNPLWRGAINIGLGMALVSSSLVYLKAVMNPKQTTATTNVIALEQDQAEPETTLVNS
jgi:hypothetical protein